MTNRKVIKFIKAERNKGIPDETIHTMLVANGWTEADIKDAYQLLKDYPEKKSIARAILYIFLIVIIAVIIFVFFHH